MKSHKPVKPWLLLIPALLPGAGVLGIGLVEAFKASLGWMPSLGLKTLSLDAYFVLAGRETLRSDLLYTLIFACIAVFLCIVIGSLIAWGVVSCRNAMIKKWAVLWLVMAVILPYGVAAQATQGFLGQSGLVARLAAALGLIHTPNQFPVLLLTPMGLGLFWPYIWKGSAFTAMVLRPYYDKVRNTQEDEARTLGAGGLKLWSAIYVPAGAGAMAIIGSVIFAYIFGGLEIPVWLGALNPRLMPADYYSLFLHPDLNRIPERMAQVLMMALIGLIASVSFGMGILALAKQGFGYRGIVRIFKSERMPKAALIPPLFVQEGMISIYGLLMGLPFIWLLITGQNPSLRFPNFIPTHWNIISGLMPVFKDPLLGKAVFNGLFVAGMTGLYTAFAGFPAGRAFARYPGFKGEDLAKLLCVIPLILPGIVLVTGAQLSAIRLGIYGTNWAVVLCHCTLTMPYAIGIQAIYQKQNGFLQEEAARTLGASTYHYVTRVLIPMNIPPVVMSFTLGFLISFTETFSTQLVGGGRVITLGALLGPALEYGDLARGSGYMILFTLINGAVFYLSYRLARPMTARSEHRSLEDTHHAGG